ncbi:MAG: acetyl-CoA C-acetyltransferase [Acidimicrobiia bacterium]
MQEIVICSPLRTPVGRYGGALSSSPPQALAAALIREILDRTKMVPDSIDDVIIGHSYPNGETPNIGRIAALDAGAPVTVPGAQVDRRCGSGLYAVLLAAGQVQSGVADLVLAGGTENMSQVEYYATGFRFGDPPPRIDLQDRLTRARSTAGGVNHPVEGGMLETAENLRKEFGISRSEQDELALVSHQRAVAAQRSGNFDDEIVPVTIDTPTGSSLVSVDEHPRADTTLDKLASLRPVRLRADPESTVTAGNASGQNDGAAMCIVTTATEAERRGLNPLVRLVSWAVAGVEPSRMGIGPVPASDAALGRAGLDLSDMELIELNEAFAAQVLSVTRSWGFGTADFERLNVNGSGISLGHPVGATGARILATMAHEMKRRSARLALETMCIGGGQGLAAVFELVA